MFFHYAALNQKHEIELKELKSDYVFLKNQHQELQIKLKHFDKVKLVLENHSLKTAKTLYS